MILIKIGYKNNSVVQESSTGSWCYMETITSNYAYVGLLRIPLYKNGKTLKHSKQIPLHKYNNNVYRYTNMYNISVIAANQSGSVMHLFSLISFIRHNSYFQNTLLCLQSFRSWTTIIRTEVGIDIIYGRIHSAVIWSLLKKYSSLPLAHHTASTKYTLAH